MKETITQFITSREIRRMSKEPGAKYYGDWTVTPTFVHRGLAVLYYSTFLPDGRTISIADNVTFNTLRVYVNGNLEPNQVVSIDQEDGEVQLPEDHQALNLTPTEISVVLAHLATTLENQLNLSAS